MKRKRNYPSSRSRSIGRVVVGVLLGFIALNAFAGGYYGMAGAEGVPVAWLEGSPFADYYVPSLVLFVVVGGSCAVAAVAVFAKAWFAREAALAAGAIIVLWIIVQVSVIGYVSWMQPAVGITGLVILALASTLTQDPS